MRISFMNLASGNSVVTLDYAWLSFKSYYEDHYAGSTPWEWSYPIQDSFCNDISELVDQVLEQDPDVLACSLYVWNVDLSLEVARLAKLQKPDLIVVVGGPHLEYQEDGYFDRYSWIDFACETDGYGEVFITELLYQISTDLDYFSVPYIIIPSGQKYVKAKVKFNKRNFQWPRNIYERNRDYINSVRDERMIYIPYESSRGCPYGCTYCEWGGGINSKVVFKPTEYVKEDFDYLIREVAVDLIGFTDANFGIIDRDIEIIEHLCALKRDTGNPRNVYFFGPSKTKKHNVYAIERLVALNGMAVDYKIPIQDMNDIVNKNIDRTDDAWQLQFEEYKKIRAECGGKIRVEMIRGLPGATLQSYYDALDVLCAERVFSPRYDWYLLPTSPAAKKEYIEKFKLETVTGHYGSRLTVDGGRHILDLGEQVQPGPRLLVHEPMYMAPHKIVVGSYSYTRDEYAEMLAMDGFLASFEVSGYMSHISKYLAENGISYSRFYKDLYDEFLSNGPYLKGLQSSLSRSLIDQTKQKVHSSFALDIEYFEAPGLPWKIKARAEVLVNIIINLNRVNFYDAVGSFVRDKYSLDISDLVEYCIMAVKWIDYDHRNPITIKSEHNWADWWNGAPLRRGVFLHTPRDRTYSTENKIIDWHMHDMPTRIKDYFLVMCSNIEHYKLHNKIEVKEC